MGHSSSVLALAFSTMVAASAPASAEVVRFLSNTDAQLFDGATAAEVDVSNAFAGIQSFSFSLNETKNVVITFMAECAIAGDASAWVDIDILVKGPGDPDYVVLPPTNSDNAFCSGGTNISNGWVSAATAGGVRLQAGVSRVKVMVRRGFTSGTGNNQIRLDDIFVSVQD